MKVITGTAKGMNIETLEGEATRPTSQRVKEAIFSMLQFDIEGASVLDLFAGSGQLGIEALSRGAKKATFSDVSRDATNIIIRNLKKARLFEKSRVSNCDYKQLINGIANKEKYDIIFIDPPYKDDIIKNVLSMLVDANVLSENSFIICESGKEEIFGNDEKLKGRFFIQRQARYSISYVTILRPSGESL